MSQPMSPLGLLLCTLLRPASASLVTIASAGDVQQCLGITGSTLVLKDCIGGIGAEWRPPPGRAGEKGALHVAGYAGRGLLGGQEECLDKDLKVRGCEATHNRWSWDPDTLHLHLDMGGQRWCLGLIGIELLMDRCHIASGSMPHEQRWVLFPTNRPQIKVLDTLMFPLRTAGRHIIDSAGRTLKLAGVGWDVGLSSMPVRRVAQIIKYMGFNSVRMSYATSMLAADVHGRYPPPLANSIMKANPEFAGLSALEIFDTCIETVTKEGLLVILSNAGGATALCCNGTSGAEVWHESDRAREDWLRSLSFVAERYRRNERVVGIDILGDAPVREGDDAVPWWGLGTNAASLWGLRFADWRVASAEGAVAVWVGDPDALVMVAGSFFSADLQYAARRPLKFADDCLHTRIVYSPHEHRWLWPLGEWLNRVADTFEPLLFRRGLRESLSAARVDRLLAESGLPDARQGFSYARRGSLIPYARWAASRQRSAYYLLEEGSAPVWVSEFGSAHHADNAYWDYVLRYYWEHDVSWCHWLWDPRGRPGPQVEGPEGPDPRANRTLGIFDRAVGGRARVVGWKLQDLVGIQAPSASTPERLPAPPRCAFRLDANLQASREPTSWGEFVSTTAWTTTASLEALLVGLALLAPCCCCCYGCRLVARRRSKGTNARAWPLSKPDRSYLAINGRWMDRARRPFQCSGVDAAKQAKHIGSFIDAKLPTTSVPAKLPTASVPAQKPKPRNCFLPTLMCCCSSNAATAHKF